jgi:hypothetical protein
MVLIALFLVGALPQQTSATNVLPSQSNTQGYVNNLISSYNALVDPSQPNFDSIKAYFGLYHAIGNTFNVVVEQTATNVTGFVTLIFAPIGGNEPNVIMDYNHTFDEQFPLSLPGEYVVFRNVRFNFSNTIIHVILAFGIRSTDMTGDYMTNSKNAAQYLYNSDLSTIPKPASNQPQNPVWTWLDSFWGHVVEAVGFVSGVIAIYQFVLKPSQVKESSSTNKRRRRTLSK